MKKFFLISISTLVLALVVGLCVIFNSSIQTTLVNKLVPELSVGKVSIGLSGATLENIEYGKFAKVEKIDASYSLLSILSNEINVSNLTIKNANIDTSALPKSETKSSTTKDVVVENKPAKIDVPYAITVDSFDANICVDSKDFQISAKSINVQPNLKIENAVVEITTADVTLKATASPIKDFVAIKAILSTADKKPVQLSANIPHNYSEISAQIRIDANNDIVAKFLPQKFVLPNFTTALYADVKASMDFKNASIKFIADAKASNLYKLEQSLKPIGECALNIKIDLNKNGEKLELKSLDANLSESGTAIANITAKPFVANTTSELENAEITAIIALPTRIVNGFVPNLKIDSDNICTKISAKKKGENYLISTISPVSLTNATIEKSSEKILQNANIFADVNATLGKNINADVVLKMVDSKTSQLSITSKVAYINNAVNLDILGEGSLNPIISRLHSIASMQAMNLNFALNTNLVYANDTVSINKLEAQIKDSNGANATTILAKSQISYDIKNALLKTTAPEIISIDAPAFPIALLKPFVPEFDAEKASFKAIVSSKNQKDFSADFDASVNSISYKKDGKYLAQNLSLTISANANYNGKLANVNISKGTLASGTNSFGTFDASAEYDFEKKVVKSAKTKASTSLPQILNQPALLKFSNIARGSADINASFDGKNVSAKVDLHSLLTRTSADVIDTLNAEISSDLKSVDASVLVKSTRGNSNAKIKFANTQNLSLNLLAESLVLEDLMVLAGAFTNPNYVDETVKQKEVGKSQRIIKPSSDALQTRADSLAIADKKAIWDIGKNISVDAKINKFISKGSTLLENFNISLTANPSELNLSKFDGTLMASKLTGGALLTFDSTKKTPYELKTTSFMCDNLDVSKVFADKENPMLTGIFDANIKLYGTGNNAEHLLKYLCGEAVITSENSGIIRLLDQKSLAGKGANLAGSIFKITGKLLNNKVKELSGIGDLITLFSRIEYQNAQIKLSRNTSDYNYNFDLIELKTDSLILSSQSGKIYFDPYAKSFGDQKLNIPIVIYAQGSSKTLLEQIGYAKTQNSNGYHEGPTFMIEGTVSKPSNNLLDIITSAKSTVGNVLDKLNFFKK